MTNQRALAADYITQFYQNVLAMTDVLATYVNFQREMKVKYDTKRDEKMSEQEKMSFLQVQQMLTQQILRTHIQYRVLFKSKKLRVPQDLAMNIDIFYKKMQDEHIIEEQTATDYVEAINEIIVSEAMESLLETSQDILTQLSYANQQPRTTDQPER